MYGRVYKECCFFSFSTVYKYNDVLNIRIQLSVFCSVESRYFEKQFELAHAMRLPMFLHMRAAAEDFCTILERNKQR